MEIIKMINKFVCFIFWHKWIVELFGTGGTKKDCVDVKYCKRCLRISNNENK